MACLLWLALLLQRDDVEALERRMVELINIEREARAIPPLELHPGLSDVARSYSRKMASERRVNHRLDRPLEERIKDVLPETCMFGENVTRHTSVDYSVGDLMTSKGHRGNLLHPRYTTIGIGIARGEDDFLYITQEFARPCERR